MLDEPKAQWNAVSGELTSSGNAMLLINPHTSFLFRPEKCNVSAKPGTERGLWSCDLGGQFFVYQGFNEKTGWFTFHILWNFKMNSWRSHRKRWKFQYQYWRWNADVESQQVTLKYKGRRSDQEKIVTSIELITRPIPTKFEDKVGGPKINCGSGQRATQSLYTRNQIGKLCRIQGRDGYRTNSSKTITVFADLQKENIAYFIGNFIRKTMMIVRLPTPVDGVGILRPDWTGIHTVRWKYFVLESGTGWIQNTKFQPFTAAGEFSPKQADYQNTRLLIRRISVQLHAVKVWKRQKILLWIVFITMRLWILTCLIWGVIPMLLKAYDWKRNSQVPSVDRADQSNSELGLPNFQGNLWPMSFGAFLRDEFFMRKIMETSIIWFLSMLHSEKVTKS